MHEDCHQTLPGLIITKDALMRMPYGSEVEDPYVTSKYSLILILIRRRIPLQSSSILLRACKKIHLAALSPCSIRRPLELFWAPAVELLPISDLLRANSTINSSREQPLSQLLRQRCLHIVEPRSFVAHTKVGCPSDTKAWQYPPDIRSTLL